MSGVWQTAINHRFRPGDLVAGEQGGRGFLGRIAWIDIRIDAEGLTWSYAIRRDGSSFTRFVGEDSIQRVVKLAGQP